MQSQPDNYIALPLVREEQENICFPLVINVISQYWGEEIPLTEATEMAKKYPRIRGSIMMEGIELAERHGFRTYIYKGSLKDIKKRIYGTQFHPEKSDRDGFALLSKFLQL